MNPSSFFALVSRMKYISRWGLMRNAIPENVQEHSHEVAVFAHALGVIGDAILKVNQASEGFLGARNIKMLTGLESDAE